MSNFIYALIEPESLEIRYIGLTTYPLEFRLKSHVNEAMNGGRRRIHKWIRSLPSKPAIVMLERNPPDLKSAECGWISFFRMEGARLVNGTDGGDGILNPSPEVRSKLSSWQLGRKMSLKAREKMSLAQKHRFQSTPHPLLGYHWSEDAKERIRQIRLGTSASLETKARMSEAQNRRRSREAEVVKS